MAVDSHLLYGRFLSAEPAGSAFPAFFGERPHTKNRGSEEKSTKSLLSSTLEASIGIGSFDWQERMGTAASKKTANSEFAYRKNKAGYESSDGHSHESYTDSSPKRAPSSAKKEKENRDDRTAPMNGHSNSQKGAGRSAASPTQINSSTSKASNDGVRTRNFIPDESVTVNLAMADLMAYLQVVANNSSNLPLTRRDDPEVAKTISTLSAEEYAKKCAAFVPADVRMIGGVFWKYGKVWDLPTSEEYDATDGAQEPGMTKFVPDLYLFVDMFLPWIHTTCFSSHRSLVRWRML
jgi:hypothetical protein